MAFARSQVAAQMAADVHPRDIGRGIAEQLAMAVKVGPWHGARRLGQARALWFDLPATFDLLCQGRVSEWVAQLIVTQTSHLDAETRHLVDKQVVVAGLDTMSPRQAERCARKLAYAADPVGSLRRGRTARSERRVTLRPAPDTMAHLSAFVPVEQGVACWASLTRHADTLRAAGDARSRDQLLTDTLVERLTGQAAALDVPVEVELIVPLDTLLHPHPHPDTETGTGARPSAGPSAGPGGGTAPADLPGFGPLPAGIVADLLAASTARHTARRLFTATAHGDTTEAETAHGDTTERDTAGGERVIVGGDPRTRYFTGWLRTLIGLRDQHCRHPYCTAPIRHTDHIRRWADGGETTLTNGQGLCERHNHTKDLPGWHSRPDGGPPPHPTSRSPPPPGTPTPAAPPTRPEELPAVTLLKPGAGGIPSAVW